MRALRFAKVGEPLEVLELVDVPTPEPGPGQVRLRMTHRPINPSDLYCIKGSYPIRPELPGSPGFEGVGVIDGLGPGVNGLTRGQRAIPATGMPGTWAEHLIAPAAAVVPMPEALNDQIAAQAIVNPMTAWAILTEELALTEGDWILQTAAGSTLGRLFIHLARRRALRTVNVVRRRAQVQELLDLGADAVICTEDESLVDRVRDITGGAGVRAAIDAVGGPQGAQVAKCLANGGTLLVMGLLSGAPLGPIDPADAIYRGTSVRGFWLITWLSTRSQEAIGRAFGEVISLLATGVFTPQVEAEYDLADFREAIAHAQRPGRRGKILLRG